ncbi:MAG: sigma-70 family RNA polymerase sigma factor [Proteobacteria bacterium]|nr:sigma-70 family RNA polymerase sigma factor [Pseudomonadota bacterium]
MLNRRYRPTLMSYFLKRTGSHGEAEDLTQEIFVRLSAKGGLLVENPDGYIFQAAANLLRDRYRRLQVCEDYSRNEQNQSDFLTDPFTPARILDGRESLERVMAALRALPERTRSIFILHRMERMKQREIAEMFGISVSAVEKQLVKALAALSRAREEV